jgi:hypothetical protein
MVTPEPYDDGVDMAMMAYMALQAQYLRKECSLTVWIILTSLWTSRRPKLRSTLPCPIDSRWTPLDSTWTHGVHLESMWIFIGRGPSQIFSKVHLEFTWTPDGLQMDHMDSVESTPLHLPDIIFSRLHVDSKWTPII